RFIPFGLLRGCAMASERIQDGGEIWHSLCQISKHTRWNLADCGVTPGVKSTAYDAWADVIRSPHPSHKPPPAYSPRQRHHAPYGRVCWRNRARMASVAVRLFMWAPLGSASSPYPCATLRFRARKRNASQTEPARSNQGRPPFGVRQGDAISPRKRRLQTSLT